MPEATIAEKPISGAARMRAENLEAEARAAAPVKPWQPAPLPHQKPKTAAVQAQLEEADSIRSQGQELAARADSMTTAAKLLDQRITALEVEKAELLGRITAAETRDCKAELARNRARIHQLYGKTTLTAPEINDLNISGQSLAWLPLFEKELVALAKTLKARVEKIDEELAGLTASESK